MNAHEANRLAAATRIADLIWIGAKAAGLVHAEMPAAVAGFSPGMREAWGEVARMTKAPSDETWTVVVSIIAERVRAALTNEDPFARMGAA